MKFLKTVTIFILAIFLLASVASAGCYEKNCGQKYYKHHYKHYKGNCKWQPPQNCTSSGCYPTKCNRGCSKGNVTPPTTPSNNSGGTPVNPSGTTTVKLCRDNVCQIDGTGRVITLVNYNNAKAVPYDTLINALRADKTDEHPYSNGYTCSSFAKAAHDSLEKQGIKCAWIGAVGANHAFNAVQTTDKGLVYFDCTGQPGGSTLEDKIVNVEIGKPLRETYLFKEGGFTMDGNVKSLLVYW